MNINATQLGHIEFPGKEFVHRQRRQRHLPQSASTLLAFGRLFSPAEVARREVMRQGDGLDR